MNSATQPSWLIFAVAVILLNAGHCLTAFAQDNAAGKGIASAAVPLAADLQETFERVPVTVTLLTGDTRSGEMIVTHYRPAGPGPFPAVLINHGRSATHAVPDRFRSLWLTRYWIRRGFAVFVPTRMGYGATGVSPDTEYPGPQCRSADYGPSFYAAAHQVATAVAFAQRQPWVQRDRIIVMGMSVGGFAVTALSAQPPAGVVAGINFAGGHGGHPIFHPGRPCSPERLQRIFEIAGSTARMPMLWMYAENDKFWGTELPRKWHQAFTAAGGRAEFVMLPPSGADGHQFPSALANWRAPTDAFLTRLGFTMPHTQDAPPATGFATLGDASTIPYVRDYAGLDGYAKFLALDLPRAFVIAPSGHWHYRGGEADALRTALERCQTAARQPCKPYAVDDAVVWTP